MTEGAGSVSEGKRSRRVGAESGDGASVVVLPAKVGFVPEGVVVVFR